MRKAIVAGVFDLFHVGHLKVLREAAEEADYVIVAVDNNPIRKAIIPIWQRVMMLEACEYVESVFVYESEDELSQLLEAITPDYRFIGDDYEKKDFTGMNRLGCKTKFVKRIPAVSSSEIKDKVVNTYGG